jgi:succinate-semialdehyde dehydrogenase/glutarate-semialdehyde dehydrogenase
MVRPDHRQPRGLSPDPLRAGQAAGGSAGEVDIGGAYVEFFAEEARRVYGETIPTSGPTRGCSRSSSRSASAAPSRREFPVLDDHPQSLAALAAGCTVVLKPANETPLTALALVALAEKAGVRRACSTS